MNDELIDERIFESSSVSRQQELIDIYCGRLMERIADAKDKPTAQRIVEEQCSAFDSKCVSAILRTAVRSRALLLLAERWGDS